MDTRYERQLKRGVLEIVVLKLLSQGRAYGYQLLQRLDQESGAYSVLRKGPYTRFYTAWRTMAWLSRSGVSPKTRALQKNITAVRRKGRRPL